MRLDLYTFHYKENALRNSLVVQWLGLGAFTFGARVRSLVGELRTHKTCSVVIKKK